jgi:hypothetical protein
MSPKREGCIDRPVDEKHCLDWPWEHGLQYMLRAHCEILKWCDCGRHIRGEDISHGELSYSTTIAGCTCGSRREPRFYNVGYSSPCGAIKQKQGCPYLSV